MALVSGSRRLGYVDCARGLACVLAILGHLGSTQYRFFDAPAAKGIALAARIATPTFMVLFGAMISLVYVGRLMQPGGTAKVAPRLISRMLTCYLVYGAITFAALVTSKISVGKAVEAMLYVNNARFGEVLKIYALLFLIVLLLLPAIRRFGVAALVAAAAAGWALSAVLAAVMPPGHFLPQFLFGYDTGFGPAVLLALTFVAFGALVGQALAGRASLAAPAVAVAVSLVLLAVAVLDQGPVVLARDLATHTLRKLNDPVYYAWGIVASSAVMAGFALLLRREIASPLTGVLATIGQRSLFFYGFGNVLINLLPAADVGPVAGLLLSLVVLAAMILMTLDLARDDSWLDRATGGFLSAFRRRYDARLTNLSSGMAGRVPALRA